MSLHKNKSFVLPRLITTHLFLLYYYYSKLNTFTMLLVMSINTHFCIIVSLQVLFSMKVSRSLLAWVLPGTFYHDIHQAPFGMIATRYIVAQQSATPYWYKGSHVSYDTPPFYFMSLLVWFHGDSYTLAFLLDNLFDTLQLSRRVYIPASLACTAW